MRFFFTVLKTIFQKILDFFFPLTCVVCERHLETEYICEDCLFQQKISPKKVEFSGKKLGYSSGISVSSFFLYSEYWVKKLIQQGKYRYSPSVFTTLPYFIGEKILENSPEMMSELFPENSILVPVPLHYFRFQKRGYNQSQLIAEVFSEISGSPLVELVKRVKYTPPQAKCTREERLKNLKNAFEIDQKILKNVQKNNLSKNTQIILIDDVVSTASTLLEIQKILKNSGFKNVSGVTIARGG